MSSRAGTKASPACASAASAGSPSRPRSPTASTAAAASSRRRRRSCSKSSCSKFVERRPREGGGPVSLLSRDDAGDEIDQLRLDELVVDFLQRILAFRGFLRPAGVDPHCLVVVPGGDRERAPAL